MDLYNWKAIFEALKLYDSAIDKQNYLKERLETAIQHYNSNKDKEVEYFFNKNNQSLFLNGKEINIYKNSQNQHRPKTHGEYYKIIFEEFKEKTTKQISSLNWDVMNENELLKCELESSLQDKYFCFSKLKTYYTGKLNENELFFKQDKPDIYNNYKREYTEQLEKIENRLCELKEQNSKPQQLTDTKQQKTSLSLKPNFDDINWQIEIIIKETQKIFTSNTEQWTNLFSENIQPFSNPIELKEKTTISDLRLFLDSLNNFGLIKTSKFNSIIEKSKAFIFEGTIITALQLKHARQLQNYPNTLNSTTIQNVFKELKTID